MGAASASARQKTTANSSKDPVKKVTTSTTGEDSYTIMELMETMSNMYSDVMAQQKQIDSLKKVVLYQQKQLDNQKKVIFKLLHKKKRSHFRLKKRAKKDDAPKKGEMETETIEPNMETVEIEKEVEKEIAGEEGEQINEPANVSTAESEKAVVTEEAAVTVNAAKINEAVVTETAAVSVTEEAVVSKAAVVSKVQEAAVVSHITEAAVTRQSAVTVNTAELAQFLVHQLAGDIGDMVVESLEEIVLRKAERLLKKVAEIKLSAEPPEQELKRTKMMTKKRKSSQEKIEERKAKRTKRREEKQKKREEKKKYFEQRKIVENPNPQQPIEANPLDAQPPEIVHWDTFVEEDSDKDYIRIKRADGQFDVQRSWIGVLRRYTRADLEEMHKVGKVLYGNLLGEDVEFSMSKMVIEHLCCMFEPETVDYLIRRPFEKVLNWTLHENCAVYSIILDTGLFEFYLVDRIYRHSVKRLNGMIAVKLKCKTGSAMGEYLVKRTLNQQLGLDPNLGLN